MSDWRWKIDRNTLLQQLGFPNGKIPSSEESSQILPLTSTQGLPLGEHEVTILKSDKGRKHRVLVTCKCKKQIPFGRYHQHKSSCKV